MAGRRNPFREFEEMVNRMSRQFEESMGGPGLGELTGGGGTAVDVADRGDELVVTADLPGYRTEEVDVTLRGEQLRISAEREQEREESGGDGGGDGGHGGRDDGRGGESEGRYIRKERRHESVSRSIPLPEEVDAESATAEFQNGVLTVTLPKKRAEGDDSHRIDVG